MVVSIPVGIATSILVDSSSKKIWEIVKGGFSFDLVFAIFGIMIFYKIVRASALAGALSNVFVGSFLPLPILTVIVSFLLGFSMGHNLGAVGISYSILASSISGSLPLIAVVYVSSFLGYLLSPIHLCVAVSFEYFKPDVANLYKIYVPTSMGVLVGSLIFLMAFI